MNKYLIIFILLCLLGCEALTEGNRVTSIESFKQYPNEVYYHTNSGGFWATKGLYNIGDTVKFCK